MTHHIIFKYCKNDDIAVTMAAGDESAVVFLVATETEQHIRTNLGKLEEKSIYLSSFDRELTYFAAAVYSVDRRLERRTTGYNQWTRDIHVYFPVNDITKWDQVKQVLTSAISYVTGDRWTFTFYRTDYRADSREHFSQRYLPHIDAVALLSGGLDSFIGAVDLLETHTSDIVFVSHYTSGSVEHFFQTAVVDFLKTRYPSRVHHLDFYVQPYRSELPSELSSRSRSFMYFVMGVIVAHAVHSKRFVIPENGFISLNVPLTANRMGSLSSRTTHPRFVELFQTFVYQLDMDVAVTTPYQFKTKGGSTDFNGKGGQRRPRCASESWRSCDSRSLDD